MKKPTSVLEVIKGKFTKTDPEYIWSINGARYRVKIVRKIDSKSAEVEILKNIGNLDILSIKIGSKHTVWVTELTKVR